MEPERGHLGEEPPQRRGGLPGASGRSDLAAQREPADRGVRPRAEGEHFGWQAEVAHVAGAGGVACRGDLDLVADRAVVHHRAEDLGPAPHGEVAGRGQTQGERGVGQVQLVEVPLPAGGAVGEPEVEQVGQDRGADPEDPRGVRGVLVEDPVPVGDQPHPVHDAPERFSVHPVPP